MFLTLKVFILHHLVALKIYCVALHPYGTVVGILVLLADAAHMLIAYIF
jgi:hypothetical protein